MMSNKAMLERHWKRMEEVTSHTFDVESESFQLRNIMEAPILQFREDIEVRNYIFWEDRAIEASTIISSVKEPSSNGCSCPCRYSNLLPCHFSRISVSVQSRRETLRAN